MTGSRHRLVSLLSLFGICSDERYVNRCAILARALSLGQSAVAVSLQPAAKAAAPQHVAVVPGQVPSLASTSSQQPLLLVLLK